MTAHDSLQPSPPAALTITEVAALTRTGKTFVWGEISRGNLRAVRLGSRCTRVLPADLEIWLERGAMPPEVAAVASQHDRRVR